MLKSKLKGECPSVLSYYTFDGMHPNETGAKIAAEALNSQLKLHPELLGVSVNRDFPDGFYSDRTRGQFHR